MATATLPAYWEGRSGRRYVPAEGARVHHGGLAVVRKVVGRGEPVGTSTVAEGEPLALKLWHEGDEASLDQLQAEAKILVELSSSPDDLPCPRLYDLVGNPLVTGLVMEWCPADLERWWRDKLHEHDAFGRLMAAMAEASRRADDYHGYFDRSRGIEAAHGDLKPGNILLSTDGRWLISDFGAARFRAPENSPWESTRAVVGTENFISPEALFDAQRPVPAAMDTWSLCATVFALLRLQRMVLDGAPVPRNGTHSPRFRMARMNQVVEVYGADPTRFRDRNLDPGAFPDPDRLPDEDRRAVQECLRGAFGDDDADREGVLAGELVSVLDRALSIDPSARFGSARELAAVFDGLTRTYIKLSAREGGRPAVEAPAPEADDLARERDVARRRNRELQQELARVREELAAALARRAGDDDIPTRIGEDPTAEVTLPLEPPRPVRDEVMRPPRWWSVALVLLLVMQLVTMAIAVFGAVVGVLS